MFDVLWENEKATKPFNAMILIILLEIFTQLGFGTDFLIVTVFILKLKFLKHCCFSTQAYAEDTLDSISSAYAEAAGTFLL